MQLGNGGRDDQQAPSHGLNDLQCRAYPATEAVLQRKAAIVALQQGLNRHTLLEHSELPLVHDQGPLGSCSPVCQIQVASRPQIRDPTTQPFSSSDAGHFSNCIRSADALPGPTLTGAVNGSIYSRQQEQQQAAQLSAAAATSAAPTAHRLLQHSSIAGKPADANLYAEEFARLRRRHQQRTSAAVIIQAAVRKWLGWKHMKQRLTLLTGVQQQHADSPHHTIQLEPDGCLDMDDRVDSPATVDSVCGVPHLVAAGRNCAVTVQYRESETSKSATNSTTNDPWSTAKMIDSWEWHRCRKAVGLRCTQVLKSQGAYGMAAEYHRLRAQGAVMFGWRCLCRL